MLFIESKHELKGRRCIWFGINNTAYLSESKSDCITDTKTGYKLNDMYTNPIIRVIRFLGKGVLRSLDHSLIAKESKQWLESNVALKMSMNSGESFKK